MNRTKTTKIVRNTNFPWPSARCRRLANTNKTQLKHRPRWKFCGQKVSSKTSVLRFQSFHFECNPRVDNECAMAPEKRERDRCAETAQWNLLFLFRLYLFGLCSTWTSVATQRWRKNDFTSFPQVIDNHNCYYWAQQKRINDVHEWTSFSLFFWFLVQFHIKLLFGQHQRNNFDSSCR